MILGLVGDILAEPFGRKEVLGCLYASEFCLSHDERIEGLVEYVKLDHEGVLIGWLGSSFDYLRVLQGDEISFDGKRALLVEDNMINMEIAQMLLDQAGFLIETAENGKIALEMTAASEPGYYDVILMDIQMPVMDGYTAAQAIRALPDPGLAGIPIIAMTANAFQEDIKKAEEAGMNGHIAKPLDIPDMNATLQRVLKVKNASG